MRQRKARLLGDYAAEIDTVSWHVALSYAKQVSLEALLDGLSRSLPKEGTMRRFDLRLIEASVEAPPRNEPGNGTFVLLTVEARPVPAA
jgi:hypothetical protein